MALVIDTGPLYAVLNQREADHERCVELLAGARERRVIPSPVLPELDHLCARDGNSAAFRSVLEQVRAGALIVADLRPDDYARVAELLSAYADQQVGFVDAAVLAIVERLGERKLATLDHRHFAALRPRHTASLELLPA